MTRTLSILMAVFALFGCNEAPLSISYALVESGIEVQGSVPVDRVEVLDGAGIVLASRRLNPPLDRVLVQLRPTDEPRLLRVRAGRTVLDTRILESFALASVEVEAPIGQGAVEIADGAVIPFTAVDGAEVQVAVSVSVRRAMPVSIAVGLDHVERALVRPGESLLLVAVVSEETTGTVVVGEQHWTFQLSPDPIAAARIRSELKVIGVVFPAEVSGAEDVGRPADRITLPSRWWEQTLRKTGLGFRARGQHTPWAWQGVKLRNDGARSINLVIRSRIVDREGQPDPIFRPRLRAADDGTGHVSVLLRVPPGSTATASLPVFVDERLLGERYGTWTQQVEVAAVGTTTPLHSWSAPVYVSRGSTLGSLGMLATVLASLAGGVLVFGFVPKWLAQRPTSELMAIAMFGALIFVCQAAGELLGMGVAAMLGPFSMLLTGLIDDALRYALLATLVTLQPRVGTATLAVLVGWLLGALALGRVGPSDLLYLGARIAWLEGCLWLVGLTRSGAWRDGGAFARWLRLSVGFGAASALSYASGLVLALVLYRLFYAGWYIGLIVALPGFLYTAMACGIAVPFAASLRRVAP